MKIFIHHVTTYHYVEAPKRIALLLKLMPGGFASQRPIDWQVSVNGEAVTEFKPNAFSDMEALWVSGERLETVRIVAGGAVDTIDTSGILRGLDERLDPRVFLRETPLTEASSEIRALADSIDTGDTLDWLHQLMAVLHERIDYRKGATNSETTAAQAFTIGAGVCQDHAQIFIAAARHKGKIGRAHV